MSGTNSIRYQNIVDKDRTFYGQTLPEGMYERMPHQRDNVMVSRDAMQGQKNNFLLNIPNVSASRVQLAKQSAVISRNIITGRYHIKDAYMSDGKLDKSRDNVQGENEDDVLLQLESVFSRYLDSSAPKGMAECVRKKEDAAGVSAEEIGFAVIKNATVNKEDIIVQETLDGERIDLVNRHTFDTEALLIVDEVGNPDVLYRILNANKSKVIYLMPSAEYNDYVKRILSFEYGFNEIIVKAPALDYCEKVMEQALDDFSLRKSEDLDCRAILRELKKYRGDRFSERDIENAVIAASKKAAVTGRKYLENSDFEEFSTGKTARERLEQMIGLDKVKSKLDEICCVARFDMLRENDNRISNNIFFAGNPGTSKSTVAKLFAEILSEKGVTNGKFKSVAKADIVGKYIGHTEDRIKAIFDEIRGGVLFIDEAGALLIRDEFTMSAVKELVRFMEAEKDTVVILAGYYEEMQDIFATDNGLKSRISNVIVFDEYDNPMLIEILSFIAGQDGMSLEITDEVRNRLNTYFDFLREKNQKSFANGREARNLYLHIKEFFTKSLFSQEECWNSQNRSESFEEHVKNIDTIDSRTIIETLEILLSKERADADRKGRRIGFAEQ